LCSVISQGKVVALDRWGGKWNHLSMTHRLATNCAKNYCNRAPIVKVIVENVVTCFLGHSVFLFSILLVMSSVRFCKGTLSPFWLHDYMKYTCRLLYFIRHIIVAP